MCKAGFLKLKKLPYSNYSSTKKISSTPRNQNLGNEHKKSTTGISQSSIAKNGYKIRLTSFLKSSISRSKSKCERMDLAERKNKTTQCCQKKESLSLKEKVIRC